MDHNKKTLGEKVWFCTGLLAIAMVLLFPIFNRQGSATTVVINDSIDVPLADEISEQEASEEEMQECTQESLQENEEDNH